MKITKEQLKQIIKEELSKNYHLGNYQHGNPTTLYINFRNLKDVGENMPGGVDPSKISELLEQAFYDNNADYFLHHPFVKVDNTGGGGYIDPSQSKYKVFLNFEDEQQYEDFKTEELDLIMQQVNDKVEKYAMELRQYSLRFENKMKITKEHLQQIIKEEIKAVLKEKEGPKYVRDDAYVAKYDPAFRKEVCLGRKRNGEFVDWFVRDGKGRCEHVTLDESISDRFALGKGSDMAAMMKAREAEEMKLKNQAEMDGRTDGFAGTEDKYDFWENEGEVYLRHYMIGLTDAQDEQEYYDDAPASRDPEGRAVSDAGPVEENGLNQEARRKRETPAQKRRRSERERRDAELPPEWRSDRPEVKTTSLKDLKKMMKHVKENKKRPPFDAKLKDGKKIRVTGKVKGSDEYLTKNSGRIISSQIDWPETNKIK